MERYWNLWDRFEMKHYPASSMRADWLTTPYFKNQNNG
jgi:hypothetical protein